MAKLRLSDTFYKVFFGREYLFCEEMCQPFVWRTTLALAHYKSAVHAIGDDSFS